MEMTEKELKQLLFEIYSAGFEAGYAGNQSLVDAYDDWWMKTKENNLVFRNQMADNCSAIFHIDFDCQNYINYAHCHYSILKTKRKESY